ncbi:hypothetical protein H5410_010894 [Solanum commersonii]|uniref:Uncharacterized protein n=1 Tax=Solanum commersonii TaxID=4109 RepID=A0A9J6AMT9_SOLCO|nr:hypothetical protein H5410_010894 [Solanum commersonii]
MLRSSSGIYLLLWLVLASLKDELYPSRYILDGSKTPTLTTLVGMQNCTLGVVLATSHFSSPGVALPSATSVIIMNIMGSCLGFFWRCINPTQPKSSLEVTDKS